MTDKTKKSVATNFPAVEKDDLTCSERQIEELLSEGESTGVEAVKKRSFVRPKSKKALPADRH
jgi:hypothetical protein